MKTQPHEILNLYFERKKLTNPNYSMRALARDMNVFPASISTILSVKRTLADCRLKDFIKI